MEKLTSIRLQMMIDMNHLNTELWCPVLNFGRKKDARFRFPIVFKSMSKAMQLHAELIKLKGKTIDEVSEVSKISYNKYKKYHYKYKK